MSIGDIDLNGYVELIPGHEKSEEVDIRTKACKISWKMAFQARIWLPGASVSGTSCL